MRRQLLIVALGIIPVSIARDARPRLSLEFNYQWYAHVSNAAGLSPQNPMWNGRGGSIALRRRF